GLRSSARVRPSRPSASGGAAPTSTVAPSPSSRWKSRRLRLRSKPAYNIETGLLSIAPSRQAGACHWGGPSSWHSLPSPRQPVATHGNVFRLFEPFLGLPHLRGGDTGCDRSGP